MEITKEPERPENDFEGGGHIKLSKCAKFHIVCSCESIVAALLIFVIVIMNFIAFILFEGFEEKWSFFAVGIVCSFPLLYYLWQILFVVCNDGDSKKKKDNKEEDDDDIKTT